MQNFAAYRENHVDAGAQSSIESAPRRLSSIEAALAVADGSESATEVLLTEAKRKYHAKCRAAERRKFAIQAGRDAITMAGFALFTFVGSAIMRSVQTMPVACPANATADTLTVLNTTAGNIFFVKDGMVTTVESGAQIPAGEYQSSAANSIPICARKWTVLEGFYWAIVTATSVGYGDYGATNDQAKGFLLLYFLLGIMAFTQVVGVVRQYLVRLKEWILFYLDDNPDDLDEPQEYQALLALVLIVMLLVVGALFFHHNEGWTYLDAFYWSFITASTIGYGDLYLTHDSSRMFSVFYVLLSVSLFAFGVENIFNIVESMNREKKRMKVMAAGLEIKRLLLEAPRISSGEYLAAYLYEMGVASDKDVEPVLARFRDLDVDRSGFLDRYDIIAAQRQRSARAETEVAAEGEGRGKGEGGQQDEPDWAENIQITDSRLQDGMAQEQTRLDLLGDDDLVKITAKAPAFRLLSKFAILAGYLCFGAAVMRGEEWVSLDCAKPAVLVVAGTNYTQLAPEQCVRQWTWAESLYWASATITTVGIGDFSPSRDGTKIFTIFFAFFGMGISSWAVFDTGMWVIEGLQNGLLVALGCSNPAVPVGDDARLLPHKILINVLVVLCTVSIGTVVYGHTEQWTVLDALYWSFQCVTTVGYGDMALTQPTSRMFSIFFFLLSNSLLMACAFQALGEWQEIMRAKQRARVLREHASIDMLLANDMSGDGKISEAEYLANFLQRMGYVKKKETQHVIDQWLVLDADGSGFLDEEDLLTPVERAARKAKRENKLAWREQLDAAAREPPLKDPSELGATPAVVSPAVVSAFAQADQGMWEVEVQEQRRAATASSSAEPWLSNWAESWLSDAPSVPLGLDSRYRAGPGGMAPAAPPPARLATPQAPPAAPTSAPPPPPPPPPSQPLAADEPAPAASASALALAGEGGLGRDRRTEMGAQQEARAMAPARGRVLFA